MPRWEKMFCTLVGSVPWGKLVETKKYLNLHDNVMNWDDSAGKEAFDNAKKRFWAAINGLPCDIPLPDPDIYIDDVDWDSSVDPGLLLDLERDATVPSEEEKDAGEVVILGTSLLLYQSFSGPGWGESEAGTGWGESEADTPKHTELVSGAQVNLHENNRESPFKQYNSPYYAAKEHEWKNHRNDTCGWNQRRHYRSYNHKKGRGAGWNRRTWYGDNRKEENMSGYNKAPAYHHGDEYHMNRGRRRGKFAYYHPWGDNIPNAW